MTGIDTRGFEKAATSVSGSYGREIDVAPLKAGPCQAKCIASFDPIHSSPQQKLASRDASTHQPGRLVINWLSLRLGLRSALMSIAVPKVCREIRRLPAIVRAVAE